MMTPEKKQHIQVALRALAATYSAVVSQIEETIAVICRELEIEDGLALAVQAGRSVSHLFPESNLHDTPLADQSTLSAVWRGRSCFLGNTLLFRFYARLVRRPNQYFSHQQLLDDVWGGQRDVSTIRGVAKRLRDKLSQSGMKELAEAIDGNTPGYYGLILVQHE